MDIEKCDRNTQINEEKVKEKTRKTKIILSYKFINISHIDYLYFIIIK